MPHAKAKDKQTNKQTMYKGPTKQTDHARMTKKQEINNAHCTERDKQTNKI